MPRLVQGQTSSTSLVINSDEGALSEQSSSGSTHLFQPPVSPDVSAVSPINISITHVDPSNAGAVVTEFQGAERPPVVEAHPGHLNQ